MCSAASQSITLILYDKSNTSNEVALFIPQKIWPSWKPIFSMHKERDLTSSICTESSYKHPQPDTISPIWPFKCLRSETMYVPFKWWRLLLVSDLNLSFTNDHIPRDLPVKIQ
jgi:hypothetical protein